jgi:murein DD-endopeptidase MepM/ murein hydrolase activator NlpD
MIVARSFLTSSLITLSICGCLSAPSDSEAQQAKAAVAKPVIALPATKPLAIGQFKLDHVPIQGGILRGFVPAGTKRFVVDGRDVNFADDGYFIIGFDRDYAVNTIMTAFLANGKSVTERVPVARRQWNIQRVTGVNRIPVPDADFQRRRPEELAQIGAARRENNATEGWRQKFRWPVVGPIAGVFGSQRVYNGEPGSPHGGVDIAKGMGTPVFAPADGVVILAASSPFTLEGNLLMIDHGMGLNSAFLHLSRIDVRRGDVIRQGQMLGAIGATGRATGPHLHWGMRWFSEKVDPQAFVGPMPSR